ncbi:MAG: hypothetical protein N2322_08255, partial [Terrimicrobiaceae bacterium]|nr:hypothetical protein [Terrimicrobiaceae bacterium]
MRSNQVVLDAPGQSLRAGDVILASQRELRILGGSRIDAAGGKVPAQALSVSGDGTLVRVASDRDAAVSRSGLTGSTAPLLVLGPGSVLSGGSVWAESTYAADFDPSSEILADTVTLGAGQISLILEPQPSPLAGALITPHLELEGLLLNRALASRRLRLFSSTSIDVYGSGAAGALGLEEFDLSSSGIRGFASGGGGPVITAGQVRLSNPRGVAAPAAP